MVLVGRQQAYHLAALFPEQVERAVIVCGSALTSVHNQVFLRLLLATPKASPERIGAGHFSVTPTKSLRTFARIYAGWAMSQDWYRADLHLTSSGAANLDDYLDHHWEPGFTRRGSLCPGCDLDGLRHQRERAL
jgi:homoserine O-acetyltransferase